MAEKIKASELRGAIFAHLTKTGVKLTANEIAEALGADLGQVKNALKVLREANDVQRQDQAADPPLWFVKAKKPAAHQRAPVIVERRSSRPRLHAQRFENSSTGRARDVLCPEAISEGDFN